MESAHRFIFEKSPAFNRLPPPAPPQRPWWSKWLIAGLVLMALSWIDVIEWTEDGPRIKSFWKNRLDKDQRELEEAEQYVLVARSAGMYPCYRCPSQQFFLNAGEIWKYGVTRKGARGRYSERFLMANNLNYRVQLVGDYAMCLMAEKGKLYNYPLLPENLSRLDSLRLLFPPGNQQTK